VSQLTGYLRRTFRTFGWAAFSQFGRHALQLISLVVLARLLSPQDFGVMSLATIVTGFIALFRDMGTGAALIQRQVADAALVRSLFSLNALLSGTGGLLTAAVAPAAAAFFNAPILRDVLEVLAVSMALAGLGVVPQAVMEREGRFGALARIELSGMSAGVITGIAMAFYGWGIWSLVGQSLVTTLVTTALLTVASGARPTLRPDWPLLRSVAGYSGNLAGFNVLNYFTRNADNFIIGKLLGTRELGYYALAYQIAMGPVRAFCSVVGRVLFPSLARLQDDQHALGQTYLQATAVMVSVCFPLTALLVALADVGTIALLGESWRPMGPILVVLGVAAFVWSATIMAGTLYMVTGRTDLLMRVGLATGILSTMAFWVGAQWSAVGVAIACALFMGAVSYPCLLIPFRLVGLRVGEVGRISARPAIGSVLAGLIAWLIARGLEQPFGPMVALVAGGLAGVGFYVLWYASTWSTARTNIPALGASRLKR
jgi:O-antigen/teichoic acid export membrane protein